jgi:ribosomal protein S18 acetylase RimI-like enzyme
MNIRPAGIADAQAIAHIHLDSWRNTYRGLLPDTFLDELRLEDRVKRWEQRLADLESGEFFYVVEDVGGDVIGFASGGPERTGHPTYKGELWTLHVMKQYQGLGLGRRLFAAVAKRLHDMGTDSLLLWVLKGNPACGFYERLGGVYLTEEVKDYSGGSVAEVAYGYEDIGVLTSDE